MTPRPSDNDARRALAAAAHRSNEVGSTDVRIEVDAPFSEESTTMLGTVDFASGRARLDGPTAHLLLVGPETYERLEDGRWTRREGPPGSWDLAHPEWILAALGTAIAQAAPVGPDRYDVTLDREAIDRITAVGVHQEWSVTGRVELDGNQRIRRAALVFADPSEPGGSMHHTIEFSYRPMAEEIELPPRPLTVEFSEYVRQLR